MVAISKQVCFYAEISLPVRRGWALRCSVAHGSLRAIPAAESDELKMVSAPKAPGAAAVYLDYAETDNLAKPLDYHDLRWFYQKGGRGRSGAARLDCRGQPSWQLNLVH
jgi:hypothetical protein